MTSKFKSTTLHMLKGCLLVVAAGLISCGSEAEKPAVDSVVKTDTVPMTNQQPANPNEVTVEGTVNRSDMNMGAAFTITIYMDSFAVDYSQKHYTLKTNEELRMLIEQSGGVKLNDKVALASDDEATIERMEEVLVMLAKFGITGYSLIE